VSAPFRPYTPEQRRNCRVLFSMEYVSPDLLGNVEVYPGPGSKHANRDVRRVWWHSGLLVLSATAPHGLGEARGLLDESREMIVAEMARRPLTTMILPTHELVEALP
jgi:hypothetical protein